MSITAFKGHMLSFLISMKNNTCGGELADMTMPGWEHSIWAQNDGDCNQKDKDTKPMQ
jgi:hypothetical protein